MSIGRRNKEFLRSILRTPLASAWAAIAIIGGTRGLFDPGFNPVHNLLHGWDIVWAVMFLFAGMLMLLGCGLRLSNIEAAGTILFVGGIFVQALSYMAFLNFTFATGWVTVLTLLIIGVLGFIRAIHLLRGDSLVWVKRGFPKHL